MFLTKRDISGDDNRSVLGAIAQLVAHLNGIEGVRGSNPLSSIS